MLDAIDDLRQKVTAHDANQQKLITQVDLALREIVVEVEQKVVAVRERVEVVEGGVATLEQGLAAATSALDQFSESHAALQTRLSQVVSKQDDLAPRIETANQKIDNVASR